jgi:arylsulfatase A-like enzyme
LSCRQLHLSPALQKPYVFGLNGRMGSHSFRIQIRAAISLIITLAVSACMHTTTQVGSTATSKPDSIDAVSAATSRPNVIVILADDMGFSDLGCYGGEIRTPNIDALAKDGVRFTQFYNNARCCPTRASIMTGLYPHQAGIGAMNQNLGKPGYEGELNDKCVTIAEVLKDGGYRTAAVGKWHMANLTISTPGVTNAKALISHKEDGSISPTMRSWPNSRGFDEHAGTIAGVGDYFDPYSLVENGKPIAPDTKDFYYTDFITDRSAKFVDRFAGEKKPFFMYVAYTAPHWPMHAREADIAQYAEAYKVGWDKIRADRLAKQKSIGLLDQKMPLSPSPPNRERFSEGDSVVGPWAEAPAKDWQARRMAVYAAMVTSMDRGVGQILERLRANGIEKNTVVIFLSDNGACQENVRPEWYDIAAQTRDGRRIAVGNDAKVMPGSEETYQSYGAAWANASNTPFRRFKHFTEEGGISAPFIVRWPGHVGSGDIEKTQVGHVIDLMPTILEMTGAKYPKTYAGRDVLPEEGRSLVPALGGNEFEREPLFWEHEGNRAVRLGKWKLVAAEGENWQLYDVVNDRTESKDMSAIEPAFAAQLKAMYEAWAKRCGVQPWPIRN